MPLDTISAHCGPFHNPYNHGGQFGASSTSYFSKEILEDFPNISIVLCSTEFVT